MPLTGSFCNVDREGVLLAITAPSRLMDRRRRFELLLSQIPAPSNSAPESPYFHDFTLLKVLHRSNTRGKLSLQFPPITLHSHSGFHLRVRNKIGQRLGTLLRRNQTVRAVADSRPGCRAPGLGSGTSSPPGEGSSKPKRRDRSAAGAGAQLQRDQLIRLDLGHQSGLPRRHLRWRLRRRPH
jgi:hypothetical protein